MAMQRHARILVLGAAQALRPLGLTTRLDQAFIGPTRNT